MAERGEFELTGDFVADATASIPTIGIGAEGES